MYNNRRYDRYYCAGRALEQPILPFNPIRAFQSLYGILEICAPFNARQTRTRLVDRFDEIWTENVRKK